MNQDYFKEGCNQHGFVMPDEEDIEITQSIQDRSREVVEQTREAWLKDTQESIDGQN